MGYIRKRMGPFSKNSAVRQGPCGSKCGWKVGNQVWNDMILIQNHKDPCGKGMAIRIPKNQIPRDPTWMCIYIYMYVCIYIYINIMYKPQFSRAWTLRLAAFFLDCVGFSLISLASNPQPCVRSTHFSSDFCRIFASDFSPVLPDFPGLSAIFFPQSPSLAKVTLNSYSRGADPLLFISVDPNSMPCLGAIVLLRYIVGVGKSCRPMIWGWWKSHP